MKGKLVLVLLLLPLVAAENRVEDFEDDTVGADPQESWYEYAETLPTGATAAVISSGLDTTGQSFKITKNSAQQSDRVFVRFTHEAFQPANATFYWDLDGLFGGGSPVNSIAMVFRGTGGASVQFTLGADGAITTNAGSGCGVDKSDTFANGEEPHKGRITWDWSAKTWDFYVDDVLKINDSAFCTGASTDVSVFHFCSSSNPTCAVGGGNANNVYKIDQFQYNDELPLLEEEVGEPSEFDSGLIAFAASAGFLSPESQFLFAMILIGLATVTTSASSKWVSPGRFKNYLLMGVQALVAVFCVIAAFLELWMFLVAFLLALFAVRGGSEVRNTFFQIRDAIQAQNDREGEDIGPMGVMEVEVSQERQGAIERAVQAAEDARAVDEAPSVEDEAVPDSDEQEPTE